MNSPAQLTLDLSVRQARGRADFLVTESNADAVAWLDRWPDWPGPAICLYGPENCGKSHLAHLWRERAQGRIGARLIQPADLTGDTVPELAGQGAIAIDYADCDMAAGIVSWEPLLHLYNLLAEQGGHLLIAARLPPKQWSIGLPDLRSRLLAAASVGILPPDDPLLMAVMAKMFADRQVRVNQDVLTYLAARIERSFLAAEQAVVQLDKASLSGNRAITVPLARAALADANDSEAEG
ncbi:MAG: DnaA/Hda family protein [Alphaproteobacteria bacterium]|nr:DnaA/Hda family protein [Alphaproteobacteria bacterium]